MLPEKRESLQALNGSDSVRWQKDRRRRKGREEEREKIPTVANISYLFYLYIDLEPTSSITYTISHTKAVCDLLWNSCSVESWRTTRLHKEGGKSPVCILMYL